MKKVLFMATMGLLVATVSCQNNAGYTIKGKIIGGSDGDTVYLQRLDKGLVPVDTTVLKGESFTFSGTPDSVPSGYYITAQIGGRPAMVGLYLENGTIDVTVSAGSANVSGTPSNDAFQKFQEGMIDIMQQKQELIKQLQLDTTRMAEISGKIAHQDSLMVEHIRNTVRGNIGNACGIGLLASGSDLFEFSELESLVAQVPAMYASAPEVKALQAKIQLEGPTAVGKKFTDFTMNTPEGKSVKLSDFVSQNEYTLVDFWASWCGPCRAEMPNVVKAYEQFKAKGFGVVGVSLDSDAEAWKKGISDLNITWAQMSDLKGWDCEGAKLYGVRSIPSTVLINKEGVIVARNLSAEALHNKLSELQIVRVVEIRNLLGDFAGIFS